MVFLLGFPALRTSPRLRSPCTFSQPTIAVRTGCSLQDLGRICDQWNPSQPFGESRFGRRIRDCAVLCGVCGTSTTERRAVCDERATLFLFRVYDDFGLLSCASLSQGAERAKESERRCVDAASSRAKAQKSWMVSVCGRAEKSGMTDERSEESERSSCLGCCTSSLRFLAPNSRNSLRARRLLRNIFRRWLKSMDVIFSISRSGASYAEAKGRARGLSASARESTRGRGQKEPAEMSREPSCISSHPANTLSRPYAEEFGCAAIRCATSF